MNSYRGESLLNNWCVDVLRCRRAFPAADPILLRSVRCLISEMGPCSRFCSLLGDSVLEREGEVFARSLKVWMVLCRLGEVLKSDDLTELFKQENRV